VATTPVSSTTRKEDDRLRKELANADLKKFNKAIKSILKTDSAKKRQTSRD